MNQDMVFHKSEGNSWFQRNKSVLEKEGKVDWPTYLLNLLDNKSEIRSIAELGCTNGWRLYQLSKKIIGAKLVGVDASLEAIEDGRKRYPELEMHQGLLSQLPIQDEFDIVIVNFVLHWVDRETLIKSDAEIDRVTKDGAFLILGDFLPDCQQRRRYHHLPNERVYTYKQDYARIFESFGTYKEFTRFTYDHDNVEQNSIKPCSSSSRAFCSILHKSLEGYYQEV
ncbi:MAG: class I SAM-dependent methyltransferase [Deltaproteobacteria bacterium]|nr:class I SAM-dependent methyltransferase [Deltaproteobacteria bacterium]